MAILTELRDPRVKNVTVIGVEVAPDMREAKVLVSIMGNETQQATSLRGLKNSAGFLQSKIAERIDTRYTPKLTFVADEGVKKSLAVAQILDQLALEKQKNEQAAKSAEDAAPSDEEIENGLVDDEGFEEEDDESLVQESEQQQPQTDESLHDSLPDVTHADDTTK